MINTYNDAYWTKEFRLTQADLNRLAYYIKKVGQACDETTLAKRVIRGRLLYGQDPGTPADLAAPAGLSVRIWDPAGDWQVGDRVIVAVKDKVTDRYVACVAEVIQVMTDMVQVHAPVESNPTPRFQRAPAGSENAQKWRDFIAELIQTGQESTDIEHQVDAIMIQHGRRIVNQLLAALYADDRFIHLAGRYFLRELIHRPTAQQLNALAWEMLGKEPQSTEELLTLVKPPLPEGDPSLFGLYVAMQERPSLFAKTGLDRRPRWTLSGPPPGEFTPRYAAYDPETYEILCLPGQPATSETVERLWKVGLLEAVV